MGPGPRPTVGWTDRKDQMDLTGQTGRQHFVCSTSNIDYLCQKSINTCQKNPGMSFSENKKKQRSTQSPKICHNFNPYQYKSIIIIKIN